MFHTTSRKQNILHRLKIVRGHVDKVLQMVADDTYCIDILTQTKAIRQAINRVEDKLLEDHLQNCVVEHIQNGRADTAVQEILKVWKGKGKL